MRKRCKRYSTNDISMTKEEILLIISIFTFLTVVLLEIVGKIVWAIYMFKGLDFPDYFVKTLDILEIVSSAAFGLLLIILITNSIRKHKIMKGNKENEKNR